MESSLNDVIATTVIPACTFIVDYRNVSQISWKLSWYLGNVPRIMTDTSTPSLIFSQDTTKSPGLESVSYPKGYTYLELQAGFETANDFKKIKSSINC